MTGPNAQVMLSVAAGFTLTMMRAGCLAFTCPAGFLTMVRAGCLAFTVRAGLAFLGAIV